VARKKKAVKKAVRKAAGRKARPKRAQPEALRLRRAQAGFTVDDLERSLAFYRDVLGFTVGELWKHDGKVMGAEIKAGTVTLWLGQDDWQKGRDRKKGEGFRMYFDTAQKVDDIAARIKARGGQLTHEPQTQSWGTRDFGIVDPDGFKLTFQNVRT